MTCNCARFPEPHNKQRLCGIGFNEFLGEVQHRLIKMGYEPPLWPDAKIRDQGDLDDALDSCVQWCAARLDAQSEAVEPIIQELAAIADACADLHQNRNRPDSDPVMGWDNAKLTLGTLRSARALRDGRGGDQQP